MISRFNSRILKIAFAFILMIQFQSCAELQQISEEVVRSQTLSEQQIGSGLKEALAKGINKEVTKLAQEEGFYNIALVRIGLPEELSKVENTLRQLGLGKLADQGIKALNQTAEQAVKEATPVFLNAIRDISFEDAKAILLGNQTAATAYLQTKTQNELYQKFKPIIQSNFQKVGANEIWENVIQRYNQIPLMQNVNPNLTDYVTSEALKGVYTMIEIEEVEIRNNIKERTSILLRRVFALQD